MIILVNVFLRRRMLSPVGIEDPGPVGIAAPQGQHAGRIRGAAPGRSGKERRRQAAFQRDLPQGENVLLSLVALVDPLIGDPRRDLPHGGGVHVFIVQLDGDDRAAVPIEEAADLLPDLFIQAAHIPQEALIRRADDEGLSVQPVRQAAVADLAVVKGADPQDHVHPVLRAQGDETAQIPPAGEVEDALLLLDMVPEEVGRDDVDPAQAHLDQLVLPAGGVHPAVVELPGDRIEGLSVLFHIVIVEADPPVRRGASREIGTEVEKGTGLVLTQIHPILHMRHLAVFAFPEPFYPISMDFYTHFLLRSCTSLVCRQKSRGRF